MNTRSSTTERLRRRPTATARCRVVRILGIGVDILAVARMERELLRDPVGFPAQLFSAGEIADCKTRRFPARHFAVRFAAKEAMFKALAADSLDTGAYREVEVGRAPDGAPRLLLHTRIARLARQRGVGRIHLSLSHTRDLASALVVLESTPAARAGPRCGRGS